MTTISEISNLFVKQNRKLVVANSQEEWEPAVQDVHSILEQIDSSMSDLVLASSFSETAKIASILLTIMAEAGQYRHEQFNPSSPEEIKKRKLIDEKMLPEMGRLRKKSIILAKKYFLSPIFEPLWDDIKLEIFPLLESMDPDIAPERFMPFRVIQIGNVVERLFSFIIRTNNMDLSSNSGLLREIYNRKYLRFGTSGVRGRWQVDFTEQRAKQVTQAVCEFLQAKDIPSYVGAEDLSGKTIVIGYDSRRNARQVAEWIAQVCIANGFKVDLANRDTPTPALVAYLTEYKNSNEVAGLINCTASHNPPEWQGIKFNPRLGYPAPTNVTDFIAYRINEMQLLDQSAKAANLSIAEEQGRLQGFDPISFYTKWILENGEGNARIPLNVDRIRSFYEDKLVVVDEMHGAGRGYLTKLLGEIGVRHKVIHSERDPNIPGLDYANPEEPFINDLKKAVQDMNAYIGLGLDTDADRFGIVDKSGQYFRPNQILPMLVRYLGVDRGLTGRVIATQTGSPLLEVLSEHINNNDKNKPAEGVVPLYIKHPFYKLQVGNKEDRIQKNTFLVPVGIKYIEEVRRLDAEYRSIKTLPVNWRDTILIGGEESSGLTTRGHVTDKDGIWADLLVLDMVAFYSNQSDGKNLTIADIWNQTTTSYGCWPSFGGKEQEGSNSGRVDIDAILEAKEAFIDYFLDYSKHSNSYQFAGMEIVFLGGIRYDIAEIQLRNKEGNNHHYLRVRASGTEPISRVYVESSDPVTANKILNEALLVLEKLSIRQILESTTQWRLVDILCQTRLTSSLISSVEQIMRERGWDREEIVEMLSKSLPVLENRTRKIASNWIAVLKN